MSPFLTVLVAAPGGMFGSLALLWLLGWKPSERVMARLTAALYSGMLVACALLGWNMRFGGAGTIETATAHWFAAGDYHFELSLAADWLSLPLMTLTVLLVGLVGVFSVRYLHRDRGFFRFFLFMHLFGFGALLTLAAGNLDLLFAGWELVGLSSVLLIAYFDERREPVRNALWVFAFYRLADLGLLFAIFVLHRTMHTTDAAALFRGSWPNETTPLSESAATGIGLLLLVAAAGKSAQAPFTGWLPRAMEGPTPSSAIFYGAISIHLGAYLLLRAEPVLMKAPAAAAAVAWVGCVTALFATIIHRASVDAKTSLAYAGMAQLGIIFVEIAFGFPRLALVHMMGHAVVRTLQFLRAPSMLHDYHRVHAAAGGDLGKTGAHYQHIFSDRVRRWLYRAALERGYYDAFLDRLITAPVLRLARWCESLEPGFERRDAEHGQAGGAKSG